MAFCTTYKKVPQYYHGSLDTMIFLNSSKNTMQSWSWIYHGITTLTKKYIYGIWW